jgi:hypothetical protein
MRSRIRTLHRPRNFLEAVRQNFCAGVGGFLKDAYCEVALIGDLTVPDASDSSKTDPRAAGGSVEPRLSVV